jgi:CheY-like chemotaxis protein
MAATPPARRVLVIDDEPGIRSFTGRALSSAGFAVTGAASGHKGLQAALSGPHDLVLLDLALPDLGGEEVLRRLQQQRPDLAVLVWSANHGTQCRTPVPGAWRLRLLAKTNIHERTDLARCRLPSLAGPLDGKEACKGLIA